MKLLTDDDIYRARLVYLGPPGYTLPIQLTYAQYGLFFLLAVGFIAVGGLLFGGGLVVIGPSIALALFSTTYIWTFVNPDLPARKVLKVAATDWVQLPSTGTPQQLPRLTSSHITYRRTITTTTTEGRR